jgi:2-oxoglutarate ferredoxin oxidoreductase subunit alpha
MINKREAMKNLKICLSGQAGQGIQTVETLVVNALKKANYNIFATKEYMSRVRGGINTTTIIIGNEVVNYYEKYIDILFTFTKGTQEWVGDRVDNNSIIIGSQDVLSGENFTGRIYGVPLNALADEIGGQIFINTIISGIIIGLFNNDKKSLKDVLIETFRDKGDDILIKNIKASDIGFTLADKIRETLKLNLTLQKNEDIKNYLLMKGSDAVGLGALAANCNLLSFYPMSPGTTVAEFLVKHMDNFNIVVEQFEDEVAAANAMLGSWYAGGRGMVTTSGGGFALMVEAVSLSGIAENPAVIHLGQRPGPATGLPTRTAQSELFMVLFAGHGEFPRVIFAPGNIDELFYLTVKAFEIADKYQIPSFILTDQYILDTYYIVKPFDLSQIDNHSYAEIIKGDYKRYEYTETGVSKRAIPFDSESVVIYNGNEHDEYGDIIEDRKNAKAMQEKRIRKLKYLLKDAIPPKIIGDMEAENIVICWGSTVNTILEAVKRLKLRNLSVCHFSQVYPLKDEWKNIFLNKKIISIEGNITGQLANLISMKYKLDVQNKILKYDGRPFSVEEIMDELEKII